MASYTIPLQAELVSTPHAKHTLGSLENDSLKPDRATSPDSMPVHSKIHGPPIPGLNSEDANEYADRQSSTHEHRQRLIFSNSAAKR